MIALAIAAVIAAPGVARADLADDLLGEESPLPSPIESILESPDPIGEVNDTIEEIGQTGDDDPEPANGGGGGSGGSGGSGGGSGGSSGSGGTSTTTEGSTEGGSGGGTKKTKKGNADVPQLGALDTEAAADEDAPYGQLAARGTVAAAQRALQLAGPLAPALILATLALLTLAGMVRGSSRMIKVDDAPPARRYKL